MESHRDQSEPVEPTPARPGSPSEKESWFKHEEHIKHEVAAGGESRTEDETSSRELLDLSEDLGGLDSAQLEGLREIGKTWEETSGSSEHAGLPIDPSLARYPKRSQVKRVGRMTQVDLTPTEDEFEVVTTDRGRVPVTGTSRLFFHFRRVFLGRPSEISAIAHERMSKKIALPVLSSDALSSIAYGPEALLTVLVLGGVSALSLSLPIGAVIVTLMLAVGVSYRQIIRAYPSGGGSYVVAGDNFGPWFGLAAGAGLMIDYILTVAVSVAAGIHAITSAIPSLYPETVLLGVIGIALLLAGNLRGVRESGALFAAPTYAFLLAMVVLLVVGFIDLVNRDFTVTALPEGITATESIGILLVLRAFASGSTAMTGMEAISNSVPAFKPTQWRNARTTITWMVGLLVILFVGIVGLSYFDGIIPEPQQTMLSQLGHLHFPGVFYGFLQITTALILLLAANTAFNGFPRLLYLMARDRYAPKAFLRVGDRLSFSNGIIVLAAAAGIIYVSFRGKVELLIPLYAVGVFLAFTLSQSGMVVYWWRHRVENWRRSMVINAVGGAMSALVLLIAAFTKFTEGAWLVIVLIPIIMYVCLRINKHYRNVVDALSLNPAAGYRTISPQKKMSQIVKSKSPKAPAPRVKKIHGRPGSI